MEVESLMLSCPNCSAKLKVTRDMEIFKCTHCERQFLINRGEGAVWLSPLQKSLEQIADGSQSVAAELALERLEGEIRALDEEKQRLLGGRRDWESARELYVQQEASRKMIRIGHALQIAGAGGMLLVAGLAVNDIVREANTCLPMLIIFLIIFMVYYTGRTWVRENEDRLRRMGFVPKEAVLHGDIWADELARVENAREKKVEEYNARRRALSGNQTGRRGR